MTVSSMASKCWRFFQRYIVDTRLDNKQTKRKIWNSFFFDNSRCNFFLIFRCLNYPDHSSRLSSFWCMFAKWKYLTLIFDEIGQIFFIIYWIFKFLNSTSNENHIWISYGNYRKWKPYSVSQRFLGILIFYNE